MKADKIFTKDWIKLQSYMDTNETDAYYAALSNKICRIIEKTAYGALPFFTGIELKRLGLILSYYLCDITSNWYTWKALTATFQQHYGTYLPFAFKEEYYTDEVNESDIKLLLWMYYYRINESPCHLATDFIAPTNEIIAQASTLIYQLLISEYETAPDNREMEYYKVGYYLSPFYEISSKMEYPTKDLSASGYSQEPPHHFYTEIMEAVGKDLVFLPTYADLTNFLTAKLNWKEEDIFPDLKGQHSFVIYANPKKGMLIAPNIGSYIKSKDNSCYDSEIAKQKGLLLYLNEGTCPIDLLKRLEMEKMLPDINTYGMNSDFLLRYFRQESYSD